MVPEKKRTHCIIMTTGPLPKMSGPEMKCYINSLVSLPLLRVKEVNYLCSTWMD